MINAAVLLLRRRLHSPAGVIAGDKRPRQRRHGDEGGQRVGQPKRGVRSEWGKGQKLEGVETSARGCGAGAKGAGGQERLQEGQGEGSKGAAPAELEGRLQHLGLLLEAGQQWRGRRDAERGPDERGVDGERGRQVASQPAGMTDGSATQLAGQRGTELPGW